MSKIFEAKIYWLPEMQGGRREIPTGDKYAPIIRISNMKADQEEVWSIVVINKKHLSEQETISEMRYLSEIAPDNLKVGMEFCLYEGRKMIAQGEILREI